MLLSTTMTITYESQEEKDDAYNWSDLEIEVWGDYIEAEPDVGCSETIGNLNYKLIDCGEVPNESAVKFIENHIYQDSWSSAIEAILQSAKQ